MAERIYDQGSWISFRDTSGDLQHARVMHRLGRPDGVYGYEVEYGEDDMVATIMKDDVIDLAKVSSDTTAALDRIHRQDRAKAELLDYLLGALSYFAKCGGEIRYEVRLVDGLPCQHARRPVQEVLDEYTAKCDAILQQ